MRLTIINLAAAVDRHDFIQCVRAIGSQVMHDFEPEWKMGASIQAVNRNKLPPRKVPIEGLHQAIIYVGKSSQDPETGVKDALGYHSETFGNIPFGFVYEDVCRQQNESWTVTLSHEVLELLADPSAAMSVVGPHPKQPQKSVHRDLEVCDPVQGDTYKVHGVDVSNFVTRAYFGLMGGGGATNFLGLELDPFGVRPGGYFQYELNGHSYQVEGPQFDAERRAARARLGRARRNARRSEKFSLEGGVAE